MPFLLYAFIMASVSTSSASSADLQSAIQAAILQDPRAGALTPVQLSAMVHALSAQAQLHGMTAQQVVRYIRYASSTAQTSVQEQAPGDICSISANFLCFISPQAAIIASLGLCALVLTIILTALRLHHTS